MKKLALATAAAAALMFTAPAFTGFVTPASAETVKKVIIKKGHHDHGRHMGWRHHNTSMHKKVIIKHGHGDHHGGKTVIKKKIEG